MTTKPKAKRFRIRRSGSLTGGTGGPAAQPAEPPAEAEAPQRPARPRQTAEQPAQQIDGPGQVSAEAEIDAIRKEGLTGRQLRMARRVAQKHGLPVTSDFDAVLQLRAKGIDPFQRANILELVVPEADASKTAAPDAARAEGRTQLPQTTTGGQGDDRLQLPQTMPAKKPQLPSTDVREPSDRRSDEIMKIQRDIARRRRRNLAMLGARLGMFVLAPTILAGYYFFAMATPMYATHSSFVIQQAESQGAAGFGSLFQGTGMATQQDSITVQTFLESRAAMTRLDEEHDFKDHFSQDFIDPIQRLPEDATNEDAYGTYEKRVKLSYDPTEGILRMEVIAADPETSFTFAEALIQYAEEQVDQLTQRLREDQMSGARESYLQAEERRQTALTALTRLQAEAETVNPETRNASLEQRITNLQTQLDEKVLERQRLLDNASPNSARVNAAQSEIDRLEQQIDVLRSELTNTGSDGQSQIELQAQLREAEENYQFQTVLVQQALTAMETAQLEANRQVRYLSLGVEPIAPDEPSYPRAFENTVLAFLIFSGIYLMISLTSSILREQVSS